MRLPSALLLLSLATPWVARADAPSGMAPAAGESGRLCRAAVAQAEREAGLPQRLLAAMARVETGRRDPGTGAIHPWPWTINAEGRGSFFPTKAAAVAAVRELQAQGLRSIDVGCMQINLRHHPTAFASLDEAFDPAANARYAARFVKELQATRNDWMRAASHYHSQTPEYADAYRARLNAAMAAEQAEPAPAPTLLAAALPSRPTAAPPVPTFPTMGGGFMLSNRMERAAVLPTAPAGSGSGGFSAGAGRGLDAYRTVPIPVAGRGPALAAATAAGRAPVSAGFAWLR